MRCFPGSWRPALGVAVLGALAGCATPPPPPLVTLDQAACTSAVDFGAARLLTLDGKEVTVALDEHSRCVEATPDHRQLYSVFELPPSATPYMVSVTSRPIGQGLFSPQLQLLDRDMAVVREIAREAFLFHGDSLSVGLRVHADEHYLLVASDPQTVGQNIDRITDTTQVTAYPTAPGIVMAVHTGFSTVQRFVYAHNGTVTVKAMPVPTAK